MLALKIWSNLSDIIWISSIYTILKLSLKDINVRILMMKFIEASYHSYIQKSQSYNNYNDNKQILDKHLWSINLWASTTSCITYDFNSRCRMTLKISRMINASAVKLCQQINHADNFSHLGLLFLPIEWKFRGSSQKQRRHTDWPGLPSDLPLSLLHLSKRYHQGNKL